MLRKNLALHSCGFQGYPAINILQCLPCLRIPWPKSGFYSLSENVRAFEN